MADTPKTYPTQKTQTLHENRGTAPGMTPEAFIERCAGVGITLSAKGNVIHYRATDANHVTPRFIETLKKHKFDLLDVLSQIPLISTNRLQLPQLSEIRGFRLPLNPVRCPGDPLESGSGVLLSLDQLGSVVDRELETLDFEILVAAKRAAYANEMHIPGEPITLDNGAKVVNPNITYRAMFTQWINSVRDLETETNRTRRIWANNRKSQAEAILDAISYWWWLYRIDVCSA